MTFIELESAAPIAIGLHATLDSLSNVSGMDAAADGTVGVMESGVLTPQLTGLNYDPALVTPEQIYNGLIAAKLALDGS